MVSFATDVARFHRAPACIICIWFSSIGGRLQCIASSVGVTCRTSRGRCVHCVHCTNVISATCFFCDLGFVYEYGRWFSKQVAGGRSSGHWFQKPWKKVGAAPLPLRTCVLRPEICQIAHAYEGASRVRFPSQQSMKPTARKQVRPLHCEHLRRRQAKCRPPKSIIHMLLFAAGRERQAVRGSWSSS